MKSRGLISTVLAYGIATICDSAAAFDFNGYLRAGAGSNSESGSFVCFGLDGVSKYRLGNECDIYSELKFGQDVFQAPDGTMFKAYATISLVNNNSDEVSLKGRNSDIGLPQIYVEALKMPELRGASVWMGRRFYKREDAYINDFFYWNPSGIGAGIEDLPIDSMKFSYGLFRKDTTNQRLAATRHDFQLRGINVNPNGELQFGLSFIRKDSAVANTYSGWSFTTQHKQDKLFDGFNKLALQYGSGPGTGLGSTGDLTADSSVKRTRLVEQVVFQPTSQFSGQFVMVYEKSKANAGASGTNQTWSSMGIRPVYAFTEHLKLVTELGIDRIKPNGGTTRQMTKFTIAPSIAAGKGYWARPEMRVFYTYAKWNDAARSAAVAGNAIFAGDATNPAGVFGGKSSGSTMGFQVESWW